MVKSSIFKLYTTKYKVHKKICMYIHNLGYVYVFCLLSFGAKSFVFQVAIQKFKDQDI